MPQQFRTIEGRGASSTGRVYVALMDWARRVMQISGPAAALVVAFLLYHLFFGIVPNWDADRGALAGQARSVIGGASALLNVAAVVFLVTLSIVNWSESLAGLALALSGLALYYGVPYAFDFLSPNTVAMWEAQRNIAGLAILDELRVLGLICVVPGAVLTLKDIVERVAEGSRVNASKQRAMQFGGSVERGKPVGQPLVGVAAKCWQLPYCRTAIRGACPIFIARTRCWRHRVGCMCEEQVVRQILDPVVRKADSLKAPAGQPGIAFSAEAANLEAASGETAPWARGDAERQARAAAAERLKPGAVRARIPYDDTLTPAQKRERCRNCVIYNEHERRKYQFLAPSAVLLCPVLTYLYFDQVMARLSSLLADVDQTMARLSLDPGVHEIGLVTAMPAFAQYILLGCIVALGITATLRVLEYCIFKRKL